MFLRNSRSYYQGCEQHTSRAPFLLLLQLRNASGDMRTQTFACVRKVALQQFGHFMMGSANLSAKWSTVSGAYGSDGLPMTVDALPSDAKLLPVELYDAWNKGEGWNSAGREAPSIRQWARNTFKV